MDITRQNIIIAEWMGGSKSDCGIYMEFERKGRPDQPNGLELVPIDRLGYEKDWNELMPVIRKLFVSSPKDVDPTKWNRMLVNLSNIVVASEVGPVYNMVFTFVLLMDVGESLHKLKIIKISKMIVTNNEYQYQRWKSYREGSLTVSDLIPTARSMYNNIIKYYNSIGDSIDNYTDKEVFDLVCTLVVKP